MTDSLVHRVTMMGTVVTIQVVGHGASDVERAERAAGVARAVEWFRDVENRCSRFDEESELRRLCQRPGQAVRVGEMVLRLVEFALALAEESGGAFDPTVGAEMTARGFDRNYRTGKVVAAQQCPDADYRDVVVDPVERTITLRKPLLLDLGAIAKGHAVDLAARELAPFRNFAIDAGGDQYFGGRNATGEPWSVGIRHPRRAGELIDTMHVSDAAVCTSGDYERKAVNGGDHIVDARRDPSVGPTLASATVIAPSAMVADGLATAALVLGPTAGIALLERHAVRGILVTPSLERLETVA